MSKNKIDFIIDDGGIRGRGGKKPASGTAAGAAPGGNRDRGEARPALKGASRAARLLLALGPERAAAVLREMDVADIENLVNEMSRIERISAEEKKEILAEFSDSLDDMEGSARGGPEAAREIIARGLGEEKAREIFTRLDRKDLEKDFSFLEQVEPSLLASALMQEHPQVTAVALTYINPRIAASVLKLLEPDLRADIARRIARTTKTNPDAVLRVARTLRDKFKKRDEELYSETGGAQALAGILNHMDRRTEDDILGSLDRQSPDIYRDVKELLYTFEELIHLEIAEMRLLLSRVNDDYLLAASLRGAEEDLRRHFFNALSQNRASDILEEMELRGAISVREVNEARTYVLNIARQLDEEGALIIKKSKEEYI